MPPKYFPKNRKLQKEGIIPFSLRKPIELRSAITSADGRERGQVCLYELSLLLTCFKQTSYSQVACATEISNFEKCFSSAKKTIQNDNKTGRQQEKSPQLNVNELLKKYSSN